MKSINLLIVLLVSAGLFACKSEGAQGNEESKNEKQAPAYKVYKVPGFNHLVVDCDRGRMNLSIYAYTEPRIEIHESYQKFVQYKFRSDTLIIHTHNTPSKTKMPALSKTINIYIPSLKSLDLEISQAFLKGFDLDYLHCKNDNNALRIFDCRIKNLEIVNNNRSSILLDKNNRFRTVSLVSDPESGFSTYAQIEQSLSIQKANLTYINFKNVPKNGFYWQKSKPKI